MDSDVHHLPGSPNASSHFTPELPTELWIRIFRLATGDPVHISTAYVPFASHSEPFIEPDLLRIKAAIVLVCKRWRALGLNFFYEEIRIPSRRTILVAGLLEGLQRVEEFATEPNGRYVRRIVFSPTRVDFDVAVLKCCPFVEVVIKPVLETEDNASRIQLFPFPNRSILSFDRLQRIEWSFPYLPQTYGAPGHAYHAQESLSALWHIMQLAPDLRYLSLAGDTPLFLSDYRVDFSDRTLRERVQHLRVLRTRLTGGLVEQLIKWRLPNLTHLITSSPTVLRTIQAPHLRVVDVSRSIGGYVPGEAIRRALSSMPQLTVEELCYILGCVDEPPSPDTILIIGSGPGCMQLRIPLTIFNARCPPACLPLAISWLYAHPSLPPLKQIILRRDWTPGPEEKKVIDRWMTRFMARHRSMHTPAPTRPSVTPRT